MGLGQLQKDFDKLNVDLINMRNDIFGPNKEIKHVFKKIQEIEKSQLEMYDEFLKFKSTARSRLDQIEHLSNERLKSLEDWKISVTSILNQSEGTAKMFENHAAKTDKQFCDFKQIVFNRLETNDKSIDQRFAKLDDKLEQYDF